MLLSNWHFTWIYWKKSILSVRTVIVLITVTQIIFPENRLSSWLQSHPTTFHNKKPIFTIYCTVSRRDHLFFIFRCTEQNKGFMFDIFCLWFGRNHQTVQYMVKICKCVYFSIKIFILCHKNMQLPQHTSKNRGINNHLTIGYVHCTPAFKESIWTYTFQRLYKQWLL